MRKSTLKVDLSNQKDMLFNDLVQECKHAAPGARLTVGLRMKLERLGLKQRNEIVSRVSFGCSPLFIACKRGHVEICDYLITVCNADVEQRGLYEVTDDRSVHYVTPLWCAAVSGKLSVIRCLLQHGADINAVSDTGSTPVRSACFMTHLDIVKFLVENGADILKANYNGGTCLINSVQSVELCKFLLEHGAKVNTRDIQHKTALHYAIQEHRLETTRLLLNHGADPDLRSRYNDDALQTACLKGATMIFDLLRHTYPYNYSHRRTADAYELMGSTFLDENADAASALYYWKRAAHIRATHNLYPKQAGVLCGNISQENGLSLANAAKTAYQNMEEFNTEEDLNNMHMDLDDMRMQSLLVCDRILGPYHKDMLFRLMYRGAAYADSLQYQRCVELWLYALQVRVAKDSILFSDTCFTAQALVRLMLDLHEKNVNNGHQNRLRAGFGNAFTENIRFVDLISTANLLVDELKPCQALLSIKPVNKRQQDSFDRILKCVAHVFHLLLSIAGTPEQNEEIRVCAKKAVQSNPRTTTGDTLLHLAVTRQNTIRSSYFLEDDENPHVFPNLQVAKLLIESGAFVNAVNYSYSTALHFASYPVNYDTQMVQYLLDKGAHMDQTNNEKQTPFELLSNNLSNTIPITKYMSLKCIAAAVVCRNKIPYSGNIPQTLETFIKHHHF